jgi:DNA-binding transcriptional MerR regulator
MNSFTIKDLANLSGIKAHTLRIWEQRYNFLKPHRTDTNIRYYSNNELKTILNIALLNKYGFKISHIDKMTDEEVKEKILSLNQLQAQQERIVHDLIQQMVDMDMDAFEQTLDGYISVKGIERTITQIIFPYLEKIGILWVTNHINPAQEHLVSNVIRQKLIAGIEAVKTPLTSSKKVLLFLPEGEYHELGLLFMYFLLKSKGVATIYIGASVPLKDVEYVVNHKKPDYLYCHLTTVGQNFNFERFLLNLTQVFKTIPVLISGRLTTTYTKKIPPAITFKRSYTEVVNFISEL